MKPAIKNQLGSYLQGREYNEIFETYSKNMDCTHIDGKKVTIKGEEYRNNGKDLTIVVYVEGLE